MGLTIKDLHFAYGDHPVLTGVDASIDDGVFCGILGANGSGKSTLMKCLIGFLRPHRGTVLLDGHDLLHLRAPRRAELLGYVSQTGTASAAGLGLTVYDTVALGVPRDLRRRTRAVVQEQCCALELEGLLDKPLRELSGGQAQRAHLARALAQGARTILLDEPISNLDLKFQVQVMALLRRLAHEQGRTVVAIIHDLNLALHYCDSLMMLADGRTVMQGPTGELQASLLSSVFDLPVDLVTMRGRTYVVPRDEAEEGMTHG